MNTFLVGVTSNSPRKLIRFLDSLLQAAKYSQSIWEWKVTVVVASDKSGITIDKKSQDNLAKYNINFVEVLVNTEDLELGSAKAKTILFGKNLDGSNHIAAERNRTILAMLTLEKRQKFDLYAIFDDDLIFENAVIYRSIKNVPTVRFTLQYDYFSKLIEIKELVHQGPVIGQNTGCPPIPPMSAICSTLSDMHYCDYSEDDVNLAKSSQFSDYYYDLTTSQSKNSQAHGYWFDFEYNGECRESNLDSLLRGVCCSRPLIFAQEMLLQGVVSSTRRGGNTYFNSFYDLAFIPHMSLNVDGVGTRRSDMIVAELSNQKGVMYQETYFPLGHYRVSEDKNNLNVCKQIISETFGVILHRVIRLHANNSDWSQLWNQVCDERLAALSKMLFDAKKLLCQIPNDRGDAALLKSIEEINPDRLRAIWSKKYENQCIYLLNNIESIFKAWQKIVL